MKRDVRVYPPGIIPRGVITVQKAGNLAFRGFSVHSKNNITQSKGNQKQRVGNNSEQINFNEIHDSFLLNKYPNTNDSIPTIISTVNVTTLDEGSIPGNTGDTIATPNQNTEKFIIKSAITPSNVELTPIVNNSNINRVAFQFWNHTSGRNICSEMRNLAFFRGQQNNSGKKQNKNHKQGIGDRGTGKKIMNIHKRSGLFLRSDIKKNAGNYGQEYDSIKYKQSISHNLPLFANSNDTQLLKTNPTIPNTTTRQLILSTEKAGINTDAITTTAKLPNKVESALNSDWEKFTNLVWNKNHGFVN